MESSAGDSVGSISQEEVVELQNGGRCGHRSYKSIPENIDDVAANAASAIALGAFSFPGCEELRFAVTVVGLPTGPSLILVGLSKKG